MTSVAIFSLIDLILRVGIPLAEKLYKTIASHAEPTDEMWAELKKLNEEYTMSKYLEEATARKAAGIGVL